MVRSTTLDAGGFSSCHTPASLFPDKPLVNLSSAPLIQNSLFTAESPAASPVASHPPSGLPAQPFVTSRHCRASRRQARRGAGRPRPFRHALSGRGQLPGSRPPNPNIHCCGRPRNTPRNAAGTRPARPPLIPPAPPHTPPAVPSSTHVSPRRACHERAALRLRTRAASLASPCRSPCLPQQPPVSGPRPVPCRAQLSSLLTTPRSEAKVTKPSLSSLGHNPLAQQRSKAAAQRRREARAVSHTAPLLAARPYVHIPSKL